MLVKRSRRSLKNASGRERMNTTCPSQRDWFLGRFYATATTLDVEVEGVRQVRRVRAGQFVE